MAKKQKIDQSQIDLSSIGQLLSNIAAESLQDAIDAVEFSSVSYNLADAIVGGLQDVDVAKIIKENLVEDTAVKKVLTDAQKKVEDAIGNMKIQLNNITVPKSPISIDAKLGKIDTTSIAKSISIPIEYSYSDFDLPNESLSVAVDYLYDTFKLPVKEAEKKIQVPVNYIYSKFTLPSVKKIDVPVSYVYDKYTQPKATKVNVPVEYDYEKFSLPKISTLNIPVEYTYDKLIQPKAQQIDVPVKYKYDKFVLPTAKPIDIFVDYVYSKLDLPKVSPINVQVKYAYDKFILPKVSDLQIGVSYLYDKFTLPKVNSITIPVAYIYEKLSLPKVDDIEVFVDFVYSKLQLPKVEPISVAVKYAYDKFLQPKVSDLEIAVSYAYDKFVQPIAKSLTVPVKYSYDKLVLPKAQALDVFVSYTYDKLQLPKAAPINILVKYSYDKFVLPKTNDIEVGVSYLYDKFTLPTISALTIPVKYVYDKLALPKAQALEVLVGYVYDKLTIPKANPITVAVKYIYDKFVQVKPYSIEVPVSYAYDKFTLPKAQQIDVAVNYLYDKFVLPKGTVSIPVKYIYEKLILPKASDVKIGVTYLYDKFIQPAVKPITIAVKYIYDELIVPKVKDIGVGVKFTYDKLVLPKVEALSVKVGYVYDKFIQPIIKPIVVGVKYAYEKFVLPKAQQVNIAVDYIYSKFNLPKATISVPVSFNYDKFVLPKVGGLSVPVAFDYDEYTQPEPEDITIPVSYDYDKLILPKSQAVNVFVDYVYSKFTLPKANPLSVAVKYVYDKLVLPTVKDIKVPVRYVLDKFVAPKLEPITANILPDTSALGLMDDVNVTAKVSAFNTDLIQQRISEITPIDINTTTSGAPVISTLTSGIENVSDAARNFVNLIGEANKRATITVQLYDRIRQAAEQLVSANMMERAEVDKTLQTLETKLKATKSVTLSTKLGKIDTGGLKPVNIEAVVSKVDMSTVDKEVYKYTPIILDAVVNVDTSEIEKLQGSVQPQIQASVSEANNPQKTAAPNITGFNTTELTTALKKAIVDATVFMQKEFGIAAAAVGKNAGTFINSGISSSKLFSDIDTSDIVGSFDDLLDSTKQLRTETTLILNNNKEDQQTIIQRLAYQKSIASLAFEEKAILVSRLGIDPGGKSDKQINSLIVERLMYQYKLNDALAISKETAVDYTRAMRQAEMDNLIKDLTVQLTLTEDEVSQRALSMALANEAAGLGRLLTEEQKKQLVLENQKLKHRREEVELIEHVANYQREVIKEVDELKEKWTKVGATIRAIAESPAFAKGVLITSALALGERLAHTMHEFKEVGMDAGSAVEASFRGVTFNSMLGLSDTSGVLKTIVQQYGTINALTGEQVDAVGYMAKSNGLAAEEATNMVMALSRMPGMTRESASNSEAIFKSIAKQKGVIPAQVMKEVAKNSGLMAMYSKGGAEGFIRAAASAKKMGVELSTMLNAARKTLDFESSIQAEMEASALIGRSLNTDALRRAALSGDAEAIQREQLKLIQQAGGLEGKNTLQKEKLAELLGLQVEDMQKINDSAKYQEEHFGQQAGIWQNITGGLGTAVKYTEGLSQGFNTWLPLLTGVTSLMTLMNVKTLPGLVTGTYGMIKGLASGVFQAGLLLLKFVAMGAVKLFSPSTWTGLVGGITSAGKAMQGLSFKGAMDSLSGLKTKLIDFVKAASAGKVKEAFSGMFGGGGAAGGTSFADRRRMVLERQRAGGGLSPRIPEAPTSGAGPTDQASRVGKLNAGDMMKGAAALLIVSAALYVAAKAFQEFATVKWQDVALGIGGIIGLSLATKIIAKGSSEMIRGAVAVAILGVALIPFAYAMGLIAKLDINSVLAAAAGLVVFTAAVFGLGALISGPGAIVFGAGLLGLIGLGIALSVLGEGLQKVTTPMEVFAKSFGDMIKSMDPKSLLMIGIGLPLVAFGIMALAGSLVFAIPAAAALTILSGGLSVFGLAMIPLANGLKLVAPALESVSLSLANLVSNVDGGALIQMGIGAAALGVGIGALGAAAFIASPGLVVLSLVMMGIGASMKIVADSINSSSVGIRGLITNLTQLPPLVSGLLQIAGALDKVASSMTKLAIAGVLAAPAMAIMKGLGGGEVKPKEPVTLGEAKTTPAGAAPVVKAAPPLAPAPAPITAAATTQQTVEKTTKESSTDISIIADKLTELITVMKSGAVINVDGRKLASVVQSNIRALKFTD